MGMKINIPCKYIWRGTDVAGVLSVFSDVRDAFEDEGLSLQLIVVILHGKNNELYGKRRSGLCLNFCHALLF